MKLIRVKLVYSIVIAGMLLLAMAKEASALETSVWYRSAGNNAFIWTTSTSADLYLYNSMYEDYGSHIRYSWYEPGNTFTDRLLQSGSNSPYTIHNLSTTLLPGRTYSNYIYIISTNSYHGSQTINQYVTFKTEANPASNITFSDIRHNRLTVNWVRNGNSTEVTYDVFRRVKGDISWTKLNGSPINDITYLDVTNITPNTEYEYQIRTANWSPIAQSQIMSIITAKEPIEQAAENAKLAKVAAEEARQSAQTAETQATTAAQRAQLAADRTIYNSVSAAQWGHDAYQKAEQSRSQAALAKTSADNATTQASLAKTSADTAASRAQTTINQTIYNSKSAAQWAAESKAATDAANSTLNTVDSKLSNVDTKISNVEASIVDTVNNALTTITNETTNIQNSLAGEEGLGERLAAIEAKLRKPTLDVWWDNNKSATQSSTEYLNISASSNNPGTLQFRYKINNGSFTGWTDLSTSRVLINLGGAQELKNVTFEIRDSAGNTESKTIKIWKL